jgi:hypothetical protein
LPSTRPRIAKNAARARAKKPFRMVRRIAAFITSARFLKHERDDFAALGNNHQSPDEE